MMQLERRKDHIALSSEVIQLRKSQVYTVAFCIAKDPDWSPILSAAYLFGSLSRNEGHIGSDGDLALLSKLKSEDVDLYAYLDASDLLRKDTAKYSAEYGLQFPLRPVLILEEWFDNPEIARVEPFVMEGVRKDGIHIW